MLFLGCEYSEFIIMTYFYRKGIGGLAVLVGLSLSAASLLTFVKWQFSQMQKNWIIQELVSFDWENERFLFVNFYWPSSWISCFDFYNRSPIIVPDYSRDEIGLTKQMG